MNSSGVSTVNMTALMQGSLLQLLSEIDYHAPSKDQCGFQSGLVLDLHGKMAPVRDQQCWQMRMDQWQGSMLAALEHDEQLVRLMDHGQLVHYCRQLSQSRGLSIAQALLDESSLSDFGRLLRTPEDEVSDMSVRRCQIIYRRIRRLHSIKSLFLSPSLVFSESIFRSTLRSFRAIESALNQSEPSPRVRRPLHYHISKMGGSRICSMAMRIGLATSGDSWTNCNLNETYLFFLEPGRDKQKSQSRCSMSERDWCACLDRVSHHTRGRDLQFLASEGPVQRLPTSLDWSGQSVFFPQLCSDEFTTSSVFRYPLSHAVSFLRHSFRYRADRTQFMWQMKKNRNLSGILEWYYAPFEPPDSPVLRPLGGSGDRPKHRRLGYLSNIAVRWFGLATSKPGWSVIGKPRADRIRQRSDALCNAIEAMLNLDFVLTIDESLAATSEANNRVRRRIQEVQQKVDEVTLGLTMHQLFHTFLVRFNQSQLTCASLGLDLAMLREAFSLRRDAFNQRTKAEEKDQMRESLNQRDRWLSHKYNELDHRLFDYAWLTRLSDLLFYKVVECAPH